MLILSLTAAKRLVSQEITITTGWVTDVSTTKHLFHGYIREVLAQW